MINEKLETLLSGELAITSLVNDRISMKPAPQGTSKPFIAYGFEADEPIQNLKGVVANLAREIWMVSVVANSFSEGKGICNSIIKLLSTRNQVLSGSFQDSDYEFDPESKSHTFELTFAFLYRIN